MEEKKQEQTRRLPTVLTRKEIKDLFGVINNFRDLLIIKIIYYCGLRVGELLSLKIEDINLKEEIIKIHSLKKRANQISERLIPIPKELKQALQSYLTIISKEQGIIFDLTKQRIWQLVKKYSKKARIMKNVKVHTLRHSYATHVFESTGNLELVRELLGHEKIETTKIYTHLSTESKKKLIKKVF
jgi:integrase/recombinase XerD